MNSEPEKKRKRIVEEQMMTSEECERDLSSHSLKKQKFLLTIRKCNRNYRLLSFGKNLYHKKREVQKMKMKKVFAKRQKLLIQINLLVDDFQRYFYSRIDRERKKIDIKNVQDMLTSLRGKQSTTVALFWTCCYDKLVEDLQRLLTRLAELDEKTERLSKVLGIGYFKRLYAREEKKLAILPLFRQLSEETLKFEVIDHLEHCSTVEFKGSQELFWVDVKKDLVAKFPFACERRLEVIVMEYTHVLRRKYWVRATYDFSLFVLHSAVPTDPEISVYDLLEEIKDEEFEEKKFGEIPELHLIGVLRRYLSCVTSDEVMYRGWFPMIMKADYERKKEQKLYVRLTPVGRLVLEARDKNIRINLSGNPMREVKKMAEFCGGFAKIKETLDEFGKEDLDHRFEITKHAIRGEPEDVK